MTLFGMLSVALLCLPVLGLGPILTRHDRPESAFVALGARYAQYLAHVESRAEGTLIAPLWVLTAAHVIETSGPFDAPYVMLAGERYGVDKIVLHPEWEGGWSRLDRVHDLALLKLDRPATGVMPLPLYAWQDEVGQVVTLVGRGRTGTGLTGPTGDRASVVRGATNRVDGASHTTLLMVFEAPDDGTELEGVAGPGDSGGPAIVERDGRAYLVGVGSANTGVKGTTAGLYGTTEIYVRASAFREWVNRSVAEDVPATVLWSAPVRLAGGSVPVTPAGRVAMMFLEALNSGDLSALTRFYEQHGAPDPNRTAADRAASAHAGIAVPLGTLEPFGYATAGPNHIRVLVRSRKNGEWRSLGVEVSPAATDVITRLYLKGEAPPRPEVWK